MKVRLFKPSVGKAELKSIEGAFNRSWLGLGPNVEKFEKQWSEYIKVKESIGVNSCTAALHLALSAFGFKPGKKVLVPVITFAATATAAMYNGLEPVFVDVDAQTVGLDLDDLERKYTKDCVAVMPVHFGGYPVMMDKLNKWAKQKKLKVVEDCAHTAGGEYLGKKLGTWGDIGCFSFEEKKCMTAGDGGMICSDDKELIAPLRETRWIGINKGTWERFKQNTAGANQDAYHWYYEISRLGYKYNMNDLAASIGLAQLKRLRRMNIRREQILKRYIKGIDNPKVKIGLPYTFNNRVYWMFMVRVEERERFITFMSKKNIATGVHLMPLTLHPLFRKYKSSTPVAYDIWKSFVTLPLHVDLSNKEIDYVIDAINAFK